MNHQISAYRFRRESFLVVGLVFTGLAACSPASLVTPTAPAATPPPAATVQIATETEPTPATPTSAPAPQSDTPLPETSSPASGTYINEEYLFPFEIPDGWGVETGAWRAPARSLCPNPWPCSPSSR